MAVFAITFSAVANAGLRDYQCQIYDESLVNDTGRLYRHPEPWYRFVGDRFAVDRATGQVTGGPLSGWPMTQITVHAVGSRSEAFKAVYVSISNVMLLQIEEFHPGKQKPFMAVGLLEAFSGLCE